MKNPCKALMAIERLVGGNFGMDVECRLYDRKFRGINKQMAEVIGKIYMISHADNNHSCKHENWENIKYEILNQDEDSF